MVVLLCGLGAANTFHVTCMQGASGVISFLQSKERFVETACQEPRTLGSKNEGGLAYTVCHELVQQDIISGNCTVLSVREHTDTVAAQQDEEDQYAFEFQLADAGCALQLVTPGAGPTAAALARHPKVKHVQSVVLGSCDPMAQGQELARLLLQSHDR